MLSNTGDMEDERFGSNVPIGMQLPSNKAMHTYGTTLTRRKLKERQKSARGNSTRDEVINMAPILHADDVALENGTPVASARANSMYVAATSEEDEFLNSLTYKDLDKLKELQCPMSTKREIRQRLLEQHGAAGKSSQFSSNSNNKWHRFREDSRDVMRQAQLWRGSIHEIEGRFGNGIRSYFAFLRWLFILNLYIFFLIFIFIVIPTIVFEQLRTTTINSTVLAECQYNPYNPNEIRSFPEYIIWWFTGQGFMENTLLFYGYYENVIQNFSTNFYYNIPLAYLLIAFFYFLLSLVLIVRRAASGLKESLVLDEDRFYSYCNKVFGGWDFCITNDHAAELKHSSLKYELETDLLEERALQERAKRTRNEKIVLYLKRFLINVVVLLVLAASMAAIYFSAQYALTNTSTYDSNFFLDLLVTYLVSIVITVANFIAPMLFELLIVYEDYTPAFTIKFTLARTVLLRLASIVFLYVVVYLQINCNNYEDLRGDYNEACEFCNGTKCWETYLGQEMYKLTILDFFIVLAVTLFVEFPRKLIVEHCHCGLAKWWGQQEFSIPRNVLDIVYSQTVGWIGAFYAPLLPVMVVIKFFVFFYIKKLTLIYNCRPATRPYRASRSGTFFFIILLFGFVVAAFPVVISVAIIKPSSDCGPFRGWDSMFFAMTNAIQQLPNWLQQIFWFIGSSGFAALIIVILCLVVYYFFALSSAHKRMIGLLKDQLTLEGKDKQFLLDRVNRLSGQLQNNGRDQSAQNLRKRSPIRGNENPTFSRGSTHSSIPGQTDDDFP
ncbi:unnamed protein product [Clavelina lepadiformis]|uniref:TMC domain-containing protein n=1 Tax=Clavelina lepadiformis TaxID=159417 RepID=A0ABP0F1C5_CLALP